MKIPYTIPRVVLQAYTRKLDDEALQKSYEGRVLRSEDPSWDDKLRPTLSQLCLGKVIDDYVFYVKFVEELNQKKLEEYEKNQEQWKEDYAEFVKRKASYDRKVRYQELSIYRPGASPDDADKDDDDDVDDNDDNDDDQGAKPKKQFRKPSEVPEEFPPFEPIRDVLDQMWDEDRIRAVEELDFEYVPFEMSVAKIPDDHYWELAALERWPHADVDSHGKKWRRLYLEKNVWEAIEAFHPLDSSLETLLYQVDLAATEIINLKLGSLIPVCFGTPRKVTEEKIPDSDFRSNGKEEDEGFGDRDDPDEEQEEYVVKKLGVTKAEAEAKRRLLIDPDYVAPERTSSTHVDFGLFLPKFVNLKVLTLVYEMAETGLDWEARFFQFTDEDCITLANAIALTPSIETFELNRSHVNDEQCKTLVREGFMKMPHLKYINLAYNRIGDAGARAIARLLTDDSARAIHTIHTVRLARNKIYNAGAKALAWVLTRNRHLTHLDLRCNKFGDPAGRDFAHALVQNKSLVFLSLGANRLTESAAYLFGKMLNHNKSLRELDLSSNDLGKKGGEHIALGVRSNSTILRVDVRLTNIGLEFEYDVGSHLRKNRNKLSGQFSLIEREDHYPNEEESGLIFDMDDLDLDEPEWDEEEEEEEEEDDEEEEEEDDEEEEGDEEMDENEERRDIPVTVVKEPIAIKHSAADVGNPRKST